jgi:hypothetical protein
MKKLAREKTQSSVGKIDIDNCLESQWFHIVNVLSKGIKCNADQYIPDALILLAEWCKTQVGEIDRKLITHADNAQLHPAKMCLDFLEQNGMKK